MRQDQTGTSATWCLNQVQILHEGHLTVATP